MQNRRHPTVKERNREARRELRAAVSPALPQGVGAVFLDIDWNYTARLSASESDKLRASLRASGAAVLLLRRVCDPEVTFPHGEGLEESASGLGGALSRCLDEASTGLLAQPRPPSFVRAKDSEVLLECRLKEQLPDEYAELEAATQALYERLSNAARCVLCALSPPAAPQRRRARGSRAAAAAAAATASAPRLDELMEPVSLQCFERGCSMLSVVRHGVGAGAAEHIDTGLLTMVYARAPGLELHTPFGWQSLACEQGALVVLAGATLEAATGGAVCAALHRVVPQDAPRSSVIMRVRGSPEALLPVAPGGTIAGFEARFRATHGSINGPVWGPSIVGDLETGEEGVTFTAPAPHKARHATSLAEDVLAIPELAALIAESLSAIDESGVALACAEMACRALRDTIAPLWARRCAELLHRDEELELPDPLWPARHAKLWKRLYRHISVPRLTVHVLDIDSTKVIFRVNRRVRFTKLFDAFCRNKVRSLDAARFIFDGQPVQDWKTPHCLKLEDGDTIHYVIEQLGDSSAPPLR